MNEKALAEIYNTKINKYRIQGYDLPMAGELAKKEIMRDPRVYAILGKNAPAPNSQWQNAAMGNQQPAPQMQYPTGTGTVGNMFASAVMPSVPGSIPMEEAQQNIKSNLQTGDYYVSGISRGESTRTKMDAIRSGEAEKAQTELPAYEAPDIGYPYVSAGYLGTNIVRNFRNFFNRQDVDEKTKDIITMIDKDIDEQIDIAERRWKAENAGGGGGGGSLNKEDYYNPYKTKANNSKKRVTEGLLQKEVGSSTAELAGTVIGSVINAVNAGEPHDAKSILMDGATEVMSTFTPFDASIVGDNQYGADFYAARVLLDLELVRRAYQEYAVTQFKKSEVEAKTNEWFYDQMKLNLPVKLKGAKSKLTPELYQSVMSSILNTLPEDVVDEIFNAMEE